VINCPLDVVILASVRNLDRGCVPEKSYRRLRIERRHHVMEPRFAKSKVDNGHDEFRTLKIPKVVMTDDKRGKYAIADGQCSGPKRCHQRCVMLLTVLEV
jgi:hypothetical protein